MRRIGVLMPLAAAIPLDMPGSDSQCRDFGFQDGFYVPLCGPDVPLWKVIVT
jgi:hypothetical protein